MKSGKFILAVLFLLASVVCGSTQTEPNLTNGFTPYGSYHDDGVGAVNLMNGNLTSHVPHPQHYPQRAGKLDNSFFLVLNAKTFTVQSGINSQNQTINYWVPNSNWNPGMASSIGTLVPIVTRTYEKDVDASNNVSYSAYNYGITLWDGTQWGGDESHPLTNDIGWILSLGPNDANGLPQGGAVIDHSGNQFPISNWVPAGACVTTTNNNFNGNSSTTICPQKAALGPAADGNGNLYSATDTMGRTLTGFAATPTGSQNSTSDYSGCTSPLPIVSAYISTYPGPNGATNQVKTCFSNMSMATSFGVSGIVEYPNGFSGGGAGPVPVTIVLPDGSKWSFQYDSYGNLTYVGLPLGGSVSYQWTTVAFPTPSGVPPASRAVLSRTVTDNNGNSSTWNYHWMTQQSAPASPNGSYTNVATDALGNDTAHVFTNLIVGFYETSTLYYQGSSSSGQLLKRVDTAYQVPIGSSFISAPNVGTGGSGTLALPISVQTTVYPSGKVSKVTRSYDSAGFGKVVVEKEYDWGQGAPGALLRESDTTYQFQNDSRYVSAGLVELPAAVVIKDGSSSRVAETDYIYDESAYLTSSGITTQHGAPPNPSPVRGNPTTVSRWLNTTNSFISSHTNWYDTGELYQQIDPLGHTTTHSYDAAYVGAYSTKTCNALNQCVSGTYDYNTGLLTSFTDQNASYQASGNSQGDPAHSSNYSYDFMARMTTALAPPDSSGNRAQTTLVYSAANSFPFNVQRQKAITTTINDTSTTYFDGLGRSYRIQHATPSGNATADTTYDALGHVVQVTNPYFTTSDTTYGVIQTQYDALGRVTQTTKQDGSVSTASYTGNCATATDEAGKSRKSCNDGLGRLLNVWEDPAGLNYETDYQYDVLGNLLRVDQKGSAPTDSTQWRTRLFTYDSLSRLLTANNPESGTITYSYDAIGNLLTKTDARGVTATNTYDALNRLTYTSYSDGVTAYAQFAYDQVNSSTTNGIGRLTTAWRGSSSTYIYGTSYKYFSYDALGRITVASGREPSNMQGTPWQAVAAYNLAGELTSLTYPSGRTVKFSYNSGAQLDQVTYDNWSGNAVGYSYWSVNDANFLANGTPKMATLGNGVTEATTLNKRLQLQEETVSNSSIGTFADHTYSYGAQNNGNILSATDQLNSGRTQTFTYDPLNRLATANESRWGLSFSYDAWGNRLQQNVTAGNAGQMLLTADGKNRIAGAGSNCSATTEYCYDLAGNMLNDGFHKYVYDAESRISQVDSGNASYLYDINGNRVRKDISGGPSTEYAYFGGQVIAERDVTNNYWTDYVSAGGKRIAKADTFVNMGRTQGTCSTPSSGCKSTFWFRNSGLVGYKIQSGDKLFILQNVMTGAAGGPGLTYQDASGHVTQGDTISNVFDQNGCPMNQDCASGVNYYRFRRMDLTPLAGMTIADDPLVETNWTSSSSGSWEALWADYVLVGADGTVHPIFAGTAWGQSITLTSSNQSGTSNVLGFVDKELCWTCVALTTNFYHDDQIGSSRLLTAGGGWPVWQGTFLPYGEEYNNPQITPNHYKFSGKERDQETGLDYFGARYYGNTLGRFITPDWAAKATAVPYAEFSDPQSLNLYTYVRNVPTSKVDADGHCTGDECSSISVSVSVTSKPEFRINEKQDDGTYETGVRGQITITLTKDGKPMANVPVHEKVTAKTTKNGKPEKTNLKTRDGATDPGGKVKDDVGLQLNTQNPASKDTINDVKTDQTTNAFTNNSTQTLTFPGTNGATCSATYQRTLTNDDGHGNPSPKADSSGSNYTLKPSTKHPKVHEQKSN